jgi:hypothetical protein
MTKFILAIDTTVSKSAGPLLRNAVAFGADFVAIIGSKSFNSFGAKGSQSKIEIKYFENWKELFEVISDENILSSVFGIPNLQSGDEFLLRDNDSLIRLNSFDLKRIDSIDHGNFNSSKYSVFISNYKTLPVECVDIAVCVVVLDSIDEEVSLPPECMMGILLQSYCSILNKLNSIQSKIINTVDGDNSETVSQSVPIVPTTFIDGKFEIDISKKRKPKATVGKKGIRLLAQNNVLVNNSFNNLCVTEKSEDVGIESNIAPK